MMNNIPRSIFAMLVIAIVSLLSCDRNDQASVTLDERMTDAQLKVAMHGRNPNQNNEIVFGFDLRSSPQEDAKQYLPFLNYLEQATGYKFKLRFTPKDGEIIHDLGNNVVQLAALGATSTIIAMSEYDVLPLVRGVNLKNKTEYRSVLVTHIDSKLKTLAELKGRMFALGSQTSTQGYLIPKIILTQNNIVLDRSNSFFTGSHLKCAEAVIEKKADVCGMQDTMAEDMAQRGLIKIIHRSDYYPSSGIVINKNVSDDIRKEIQNALVQFSPSATHDMPLYNWNKTEMPGGFNLASSKDYKDLERWMVKLGMLAQ